MKLISYWSDDIADELFTMPGFAINAMTLRTVYFKNSKLEMKSAVRYNYLHIRVQIYKRFYMFDIRLGRIIGKL